MICDRPVLDSMPRGQFSKCLRTPAGVRNFARSCAKLWSPSFLVDNMAERVQVKQSDASKAFMYNEGNIAHLLPDDMGLRGETSLVDVSPTEMVKLMEGQDVSSGPWHYYTSPLQDMGGDDSKRQTILDAAKGWKDLIVDPNLSKMYGEQEFISAWVGGPGTTTKAHYDVLDNMFCQVYGRKTFRLWGPDHVSLLKVFPDLHPRARKSQFKELFQGNDTDDDMAFLDVELGPGDSLYIPAFVFHQVEVVEGVSISLNVFSPCNAQLCGSKMLSIFPNLKNVSVPEAEAMDEASANFAKAVSHVLPCFGLPENSEDARLFVLDHLLNARYRPLYGTRAGTGATNPSNASKTLRLLQVDHFVRSELSRAWEDMGRCFKADESPYADIENSVEGIRTIILAHLLESWCLTLVGDPKKVHECLERSLADF